MKENGVLEEQEELDEKELAESVAETLSARDDVDVDHATSPSGEVVVYNGDSHNYTVPTGAYLVKTDGLYKISADRAENLVRTQREGLEPIRGVR